MPGWMGRGHETRVFRYDTDVCKYKDSFHV